MKDLKNINNYYNAAINVADQILKDPQNSVSEVLKNQLGYDRGIRGFLNDPWNLIFIGQPLLLGGRMFLKYLKNKERKQQEMEMMKRNIIAKQQAIIKRMEQENYENEQQRKNLQETIDFLEETLKRIEKESKSDSK